MPKRVLIFSLNYYPRFVGGAEVAIKEITDRISPELVEFHLLTLRFDSTLPRYEKIGNVHVHRIGFTQPNPSIADLVRFPLKLNKHLFQLYAAWAAHKLHRKYRFSVTWAMMAHSCGIPAGIFKKAHPEVKYLLTLQEGDPPEHIEGMMRPVWPLFRAGFLRADALQTISTFLAQWGLRMGFTGSPQVVPNGVDAERFAQEFTAQQRSDAQRELGKREGEVYLVTTSRLVHKNGIDTVIRALPHLPVPVLFLVYGIGPLEEDLRALAGSLGVSDRVRFMGEVQHTELPRLLSACDIFIRPSRSEGMGNSFIEAMAAGLPVIATQEGGIADFLFDAERNPDVSATGWAVDADDHLQVARAVTQILDDPDNSVRTTAYARSVVLEKYQWDMVALRMQEILLRLAKV